MKKNILPLLLFFIASQFSHPVSANDAVPPDDAGAVVMDGEKTPPDTYMPPLENYPSFTFELLRMDYLYNLDDKASSPFHSMKKFDWRNLLRGNGAILYGIRINKSRFAFWPGVGWSTVCYAFSGKEDKTSEHGRIYPRLVRESESHTECSYLGHEPGKVILGSAVKIPFIDLLLRLRFNSVLDDPKAGFHTWMGIKLGFLRRPSMLIDYREYNDSGASEVYNGYFNLKSYAWALQAGMGYSRFGLMGSFHFTPLFEQGCGPSHSDPLRPFSVGIYVDLV